MRRLALNWTLSSRQRVDFGKGVERFGEARIVLLAELADS